jgi:thiol-disulfide isomerase/thioredoxin
MIKAKTGVNVWLSIASILYVIAFFVLHHYVTNVWVAHSYYSYLLLSYAVHYTVAALLFRLLFNSDKLFVGGLLLFEASILLTVLLTGLVSLDEPGLFYPTYFPLYLLINSAIVWIIFKVRKAYYALIVALLIAAYATDLYYLPKITKANSEATARSNIGARIDSLTFQDIYGSECSLPRPGINHNVIFVSFIECLPCRLMAPFMEEVCGTFKSGGIDVLKVNPIDDLPEIKQEAAGHTTSCLHTLIPLDKERFKKQLGVKGYPLMLITNESGQVVYAHYGYNPREHDALLEEIKRHTQKQ